MHLGIIGCGKMGTALVAGAIRAGVVNCADVIGCDPSPASREAFSQATGALATPTPASLAATCDVILLCTKPHDVLTAMREIAAATATASQPRLILSIAAGIPLTTLEAAAPAHFRLIRAMPNTPALVGKGAAGSWSINNLGPRIVADNYAPGFFVEHFIKDMGIAIESAKEMGLELPGLALAKSLYDKLEQNGYGYDGTQALYRLFLDDIQNGQQ